MTNKITSLTQGVPSQKIFKEWPFKRCLAHLELDIEGQPIKKSLCKQCRDECKAKYRKNKYLNFGMRFKFKVLEVKRRRRCTVDHWYLLELLRKQEGKCALSGTVLTTHNVSLDRIDSSRDYVRGNIQLTTVYINMAKNDLTNQEFIDMCCQVANKFPSRAVYHLPSDSPNHIALLGIPLYV